MIYSAFDIPTGNFKYVGETNVSDLSDLNSQYTFCFEGEHSDKYLLNGELVSYTPEQLSSKLVSPGKWDNTTMSSVQAIDATVLARASKWEQIKQARDLAMEADLVTPYGIFDNKSKDQDNIDKVIRWMQTKGVESVDFTMADNSVQNLTMAQMLDVGVRTGDKVLYAHAKGRILRAQIEQATIEEIEAITWD